MEQCVEVDTFSSNLYIERKESTESFAMTVGSCVELKPSFPKRWDTFQAGTNTRASVWETLKPHVSLSILDAAKTRRRKCSTAPS